MNKIIKMFVILFGFAAVYFSLGQLAFKNTIFADSKKVCCNNFSPGPDYIGKCNGISGVDLHNDGNCDHSDDMTFTIFDCVRMLKFNPANVCGREAGGEYVFCILSNDNRYSTTFGEEKPLKVYINGPMFVEPGQSAQFFITTEGGAGHFHYQWYIYYPCNGSKAAPCGVWLKRGSDISVFNTSQTRDFHVKCVVTSGTTEMGNFTTVSSQVKEVYVGSEKSKNNSNMVQKVAELYNYPNPFNPTTLISYDLKKKGNVSLKVYDNLGNEIVELVNEYKNVGNYKVGFNASDLASGVYYYRLTTDYSNTIKRMILVK